MARERNPDRAASEQEPAIEQLMGGGAAPPRRRRDLTADAAAAAEQALRRGRHAVEEAEQAQRPAPPTERLSPRLRHQLLRAMLGLNLLLMVLMLLVPDPVVTPAQPAAPQRPTPPLAQPVPQPELRDARDLAISVPDRELYDRAVVASLEGRHEEAVALLEHYLRRHPEMPPALRATVYNQLAHYSVLLNRREDAHRYGTMAAQLRQRTALPDELIESARRAAADGRGSDMRRDYARLLLQQQMLRPDQRAAIAEAYLRLGDSYRIEAEQGAGAAPPPQEQRK